MINALGCMINALGCMIYTLGCRLDRWEGRAGGTRIFSRWGGDVGRRRMILTFGRRLNRWEGGVGARRMLAVEPRASGCNARVLTRRAGGLGAVRCYIRFVECCGQTIALVGGGCPPKLGVFTGHRTVGGGESVERERGGLLP